MNFKESIAYAELKSEGYILGPCALICTDWCFSGTVSKMDPSVVHILQDT